MVHLYDYWRSSAAYRVRIALSLKGIAYERTPVNLLENEQGTVDNLARNPQGFVPTLEIDGLQLSQSLAIIDYLDAKFPAPRLVPVDPEQRARTWARALAIAADIHPITNLRVMKYLSRVFDIEQERRDEWYRHWIDEGFIALERMAGDGPFLGGEAPDMSDVCLVPQMFNARRLNNDLTAFPKLVRIDEAARALEPFAAAHPENFDPAISR